MTRRRPGAKVVWGLHHLKWCGGSLCRWGLIFWCGGSYPTPNYAFKAIFTYLYKNAKENCHLTVFAKINAADPEWTYSLSTYINIYKGLCRKVTRRREEEVGRKSDNQCLKFWDLLLFEWFRRKRRPENLLGVTYFLHHPERRNVNFLRYVFSS